MWLPPPVFICQWTNAQRSTVNVISAFWEEMTAFLKYILKGKTKPFGKLNGDYFARIEHRNGGSSHLHIFLWIEDAHQSSIAHSHENGSSSGFFVLWSNNPCSLHKICNRVNFLLDLDKIYTDIYSFLYFWLQIHTTFAPKDLKTRKMACPQRYTWFFQRYISIKMQLLNAHNRIFPSKIHKN